MSASPSTPRASPSIVRLKVNFPAGVVMDSAHPLTKRTTVTPEDCRGYSVLRVGGLTSTDDIVSSDMANLWNTLVRAVTCNSTMMLKQMVMAGQGLAFLSKVAFLEESANGTAVWRPFAAGMSGTQDMAVVISSLRVLSPVTRDFVAETDSADEADGSSFGLVMNFCVSKSATSVALCPSRVWPPHTA
jgi:DNA-binding transcriptional LysR family regulator